MVFTGPKITWRYELVSLQRGSDNKSSVHHITWDGAVTGILTHVTVPLVMLVLFIVTWSSHGAMLSPLDTKCPEAPSSYQVASVSLSHGLSESITYAVKLLSYIYDFLLSFTQFIKVSLLKCSKTFNSHTPSALSCIRYIYHLFLSWPCKNHHSSLCVFCKRWGENCRRYHERDHYGAA